MAIFNYHFISQPQILASSSLPNNNSSPQPQLNPNKIPKVILNKKNQQIPQQENLKHKNLQQPSVLEIEQAIGAGIFRDRDPNSSVEENRGLFDNLLRSSVGKNEGEVEKKLRETGEWLIDRSEKSSNSVGKQILLTMFTWILPLWIFAFLVASGIVQLPFNTPFLEDILS